METHYLFFQITRFTYPPWPTVPSTFIPLHLRSYLPILSIQLTSCGVASLPNVLMAAPWSSPSCEVPLIGRGAGGLSKALTWSLHHPSAPTGPNTEPNSPGHYSSSQCCNGSECTDDSSQLLSIGKNPQNLVPLLIWWRLDYVCAVSRSKENELRMNLSMIGKWQQSSKKWYNFCSTYWKTINWAYHLLFRKALHNFIIHLWKIRFWFCWIRPSGCYFF